MVSDYDKRQLVRMSDAINYYLDKKINLRQLINDLDFLYDAIEGNFKNELFQSKFYKNINELEIISALGNEDKKMELILNDYISNLKKLITSYV